MGVDAKVRVASELISDQLSMWWVISHSPEMLAMTIESVVVNTDVIKEGKKYELKKKRKETRKRWKRSRRTGKGNEEVRKRGNEEARRKKVKVTPPVYCLHRESNPDPGIRRRVG